jgi:hypothetical protein
MGVVRIVELAGHESFIRKGDIQEARSGQLELEVLLLSENDASTVLGRSASSRTESRLR